MIKTILPVERLEGEVEIPGDKSISHRALMVSAISQGSCHIDNPGSGADIKSTISCLRQLGVQITEEGGAFTVKGVGLNGLQESEHALNVGNSGTTMRLLSGILAGYPFITTMTGDKSICHRPMDRIFTPLRQMGAEISATNENHAPFSISGGNLRGVDYTLPIASAQVKSCILLAGLYADGQTKVTEPATTRDHTELMLARFGASIHRVQSTISVSSGPKLQGHDLYIPGDISSAAFFLGAGSVVKDAGILIRNVGINPTRVSLLTVLDEMNAQIDIMNVRNIASELIADLYVRNSNLKSVSLQGAIIPQIIDEIPILAILATQAEGTTVISGAEELRHKESDRLRSIKFNLERMGAKVSEQTDGLIIEGGTRLKGADIECFSDHRIAMAFSIAGLIADGETTIKSSETTEISFPGFHEKLYSLIQK